MQAVDVVISMGGRVTCPVFPGKQQPGAWRGRRRRRRRSHQDWPVDDPAGQDPARVRRIVDDVDARVRALLADLGVPG